MKALKLPNPAVEGNKRHLGALRGTLGDGARERIIQMVIEEYDRLYMEVKANEL